MNKKLWMIAPLAALTLAGSAFAQGNVLGGQDLEIGVTGGLSGGLGAEGFVHVPNLAGPIGVRGSASFSSLNDPINDETANPFDLELKESGSATMLGLDGTYGLGELTPGLEATAYAGGRYGIFSADINTDIGDTSYSANAFGVGAGVMLSYPVNATTSIVGDLGIDNFFGGDITYKDGSQSETLGSDDVGYEALDDNFNQPSTVFKVRAGVKFSL